ncbi:MAG: biotin--[acetyl-CoA-carboxylase] ligase [Pseudomonadota bacterium]|jgi:BirA family biotin operon repressor/biotin-[acetyl-CoA-carboxylase] ligase|nr:biotin--[acetyl-CoA-carboxylase] ligase [Pseudomonadota bacterium]
MAARRGGTGGAERSGNTLPLAAQVFARLSDGRFHSGEALAEALHVSRGAVWKAVRALRDAGTPVHAVPNRGYRLPAAGEPICAARILERLPQAARGAVCDLQTLWQTDSTNSVLLARANPPFEHSEVVLAEFQTAGRGRRGRTWLAPPGGAICLSLSWTFREVPPDLGALGLAVGVCVLRALRESGLEAELKWPNDLLVKGRKLGGILIELRAESAGPACVVIGLGLNASLGEPLLRQIASLGLPATDLASVGVTVSRNVIAAAILTHVLQGLRAFEREALRPFIEAWRAADALRGVQVNVQTPSGAVQGVARGIDLHGALLIETTHGVQRFISGDVTVRPVQ